MSEVEHSPEIPGYRVLRRLGRGGMASVWLAEQVALARQVALKVMPADDQDAALRLRFEQEARVIARLDHPHIVTIHEVGRTQAGEPYYAMRYLPQGDLRRQGRLDETRLREVMLALCSALDYAHAQGIVHRDVKPENVLFDQFGQPLLADFGIAYSRSEPARLTGEGTALGSTGYMSPEQARGEPLDGRSDLYALGVVLYELLVGRPPFEATDPLALALAHQQDPVPELPEARAHWQPIIDRLLAKRPEQRYASAAALAADIRALPMPEPVAATASRPKLSLPLGLRGLALLGLGLLAGLALMAMLWPGSALRDERAVTTEPLPLPPEPEPELELAPLSAEQIDAELAAIAELAARFETLEAGLERLEALEVLLPGLPETQALREAIAEALPTRVFEAERPEPDQVDALLARVAAGLGAGEAEAIAAETLRLEQRLGLVLVDRIGKAGPARLQALRPLAEHWAARDPAVAAALRAADSRPRHGSRIRDPGGPELVVVEQGGSAFAMMVHELSRDEYALFARETRRAAAACRSPQAPLSGLRRIDWTNPGFDQSGEHPVVCVSWDDAVAYAQWLSRRTGQRYRLPSAREWLRAAGPDPGGSPCALGNVYDRGAGQGRDVLACSDGFPRTAPRGRFPPNALGIHDLRGNVSEWVADCADLSAAAGAGGPCRQRTIMGASWRDGGDIRLDFEGRADADRGQSNIGIRLVREI